MVAVKVTLVPAQTVVPGFALMLIVGVTGVVTVMASVLLFTVVTVGQTALLASVQVTVFPLSRPDVLYVGELLPTGDPPTNHW